MPLSKARLLIGDALKLRVADSLNTNLNARIVLLESQYETSYSSFTNLLKISEANLTDQKAISADFQKHSQSFSDQLSYYEKINRKQKRQNFGLKVLLGLAGVFIGYESIKN